MPINLEQILFFLEVAIFISIFSMNFVKKNSHLVTAYVIQSLAIVIMTALEGIGSGSWQLLLIALIILIIKVIVAPYYFFNFVKKSKLNLLTSTYLSTPISLLVLTLFVFLANSSVFQPLNVFIGKNPSLSTMLIAGIFSSAFILINRKGSLSQIIGILSIENSIVAFGFFLGITQKLVIEIGILFDVFVFLILAVFFIELIHKSLKTSDVSELNKLKD